MTNWVHTGCVMNRSYVTEELLSTGESVMTYLCKSIKTWELCVIKVLRRAVSESSSNNELRFYREFSAASNIKHTNVIAMKELFTHKNLPSIVMEYAPNGDLAKKLMDEGKFPSEKVTKIALEICEGLQAIHHAGIVHRDLKPENILFSANDEVKIADFGIAHFREKKRLTGHNSLLGTVGYMSPEYIERGLIDEQSDIYALGVIMYEMVSGRLPFMQSNGFEQLQSVINDEAPDIQMLCPDCPNQLALCIRKAMSRNRSERYKTVQGLINDLQSHQPKLFLGAEELDEIAELTVTDTVVFGSDTF